jgi:glutamine cyclotransferase
VSYRSCSCNIPQCQLEVIDGELWGNIWQTECIARINLMSGHVTHWLLMHGLKESLRKRNQAHPLDVLNGALPLLGVVWTCDAWAE